MPGPLLQTQDIANGAITGQPRKFGRANQGSARAARVFFYFRTANVPVSMPHSFGKTPTAWRLVSVSRGNETFEVTTNGTTTLTCTGTGANTFANIQIGTIVTGTGITAGTYVAAKASDTSLTLSAAATDSTTGNRTFTGFPGTVYSPTSYSSTGSTSGASTTSSTRTGNIFNLGRNYVALACTTANTWAEVELT